jgi:type IV fimbrial biogenesis protein FimT
MLNRRVSRQRGVTLIEISVTLAVLGLMLAVAMPEATDWLRNTRIRNAAESAQNGIGKARMEALRRNQVVSFWMVSDRTNACVLSANSASWVVSVDDPTGQCAADPSSTTAPRLVEVYGAGDGAADVVVAALAADNATAATSVSFNGFGQVVSGGAPIATINLSNANAGTRRLRLTISTGGAIRMCDPLAAAGDTRACS